EAGTVELYQGRDKPIIVAIIGTVHPQTGPGLTIDPRRLNVMLTRHRCALLIIRDIHV
ncbi:hypothetical protein B0T18DRAFT_310786, partial [Schizothecium vesticola]